MHSLVRKSTDARVQVRYLGLLRRYGCRLFERELRRARPTGPL